MWVNFIFTTSKPPRKLPKSNNFPSLYPNTSNQELVAVQDGQRCVSMSSLSLCEHASDGILQYTSLARYAVSLTKRSFDLYGRVQVAIVLQGRQAGKKVVVIKQLDEGSKERPFPHAIVAGIERYPRKVTRRMGQKKLAHRSKVKPFIKVRFIFWGGLGIAIFISLFRLSTTRTCSLHVTPLNWRPSRDP